MDGESKDLIVKVKTEPDHNSQKAKELLEWLKNKGGEVLKSLESVFDTVTGRTVLEKIAEYVQESEAVNTAMATRIYDLLDREARLRKRVTAAEAAHKRFLVISSVLHAACICAIVYLAFSR